MLRFRTFRNDDPPFLMLIWNESATGRGAIRLAGAGVLERAVFSKPYFDPEGLIVSEFDGTPIGFAHAGFGPNDDESAIDPARGVICAVLVRPEFRRRGIGTELLQRAEAHLHKRGTRTAQAGPARPRDPFYFGLYGGSDLSGFFESDRAARPFLEKFGYVADQEWSVLQRRIDDRFAAPDPRFAEIRRKFEIRAQSLTTVSSWWQECVLGLVEPAEFRLEDRLTNQPMARAVAWDMDGYSERSASGSAGILDLVVRSEWRRRGLGRFLVTHIMRIVREQGFHSLEIHCSADNAAALGLLHGLGFVQVDTGRTYSKRLVTVDPTSA